MKDFRINLPVGAFFLLFAVSGFAGLIYESIWTHYLKLFLGHAAYAQTLVLAIFMGGMALGSWLTGLYSLRLRNLLLGYAIVEALIGVAALSFHTLFVGATNFAYDTALPSFDSPAAANTFKWCLAALFILPQSVLLGMTFPLMSGGILRRYPGTPGHSLATLYFSNSIGAAGGVLMSGFVLVGLVGLPGTMLTAGLMNIALALVVWLLARGQDERSAAGPAAAPEVPWRRDRFVWVLLLAAAVTGAASFLYEIAWIRMLTLVLGGSTHSFELMLSAFILGLALGSLYVRRRIDRIAEPIRYLGYVQLLMGVLALATIPMYGKAFDWMAFLMSMLSRTEQGYVGYTLASSLICLLVMLPATFLAGMTLPLVTLVLLKRGHGERTIGSVYAANTVGAILGILLAVHVLMPAVGVKGVVTIGAALDLALGVALLAMAAPALRRFELPATAVAALLAVAFIASAVEIDPRRMLSAVYRSGKPIAAGKGEIEFRRDGKTASIGLVRSMGGARVISTNGKPDAMLTDDSAEAGPDEATMVLAGALALAHHPQARTAANIGFGSGLTTHAMLSTPQLERIDTIEIERFMVEAARGFGHRVRNAFEDPRSRIYFEDAKAFFATRNARYDIIISEPSNPWVSGVSSLFSTEFYSRVRNHLSPDGIFVQWVQAYEIDMPLIASILKALDPHFSDYVVYGTNEADLLIVARRDGALPPLDERALAYPAMGKELRRVKVESIQDLEVRRLAGKRLIQALLTSYAVPANSDYFPFLDQNAARALFADRNAISDLAKLRAGELPLVEMLEGRLPSWTETKVVQARDFARTGLTADAMRTRDAILGRGDWTNGPRGTHRDWMLVSMMLDACDPRADWGQWLDAVRRVVISTVPYLTRGEAAQVVAKIRKHRCIARLPVDYVRWVELLEAVALRDAGRMHAIALSLLEEGRGDSNPMVKSFLVHSAMTGALARQSTEDARAIWESHGKSLAQNLPLEFDTRLLVSIAEGARPQPVNVGGLRDPLAGRNGSH
jgi:predicted membrane-bound spermidine synthase